MALARIAPPDNIGGMSFGIHRLSPRESLVYNFMREGWKTEHIARVLGIAEKTAEQHVMHVKDKMGTRDAGKAKA